MPDFMSKIAAMQERTAEIKKQEETAKVKTGDEKTIQSQFDSVFSGGGNGAKPKQEQEPTLNPYNHRFPPKQQTKQTTRRPWRKQKHPKPVHQR